MHLTMARDLDGPSLAIAQQAEAYVRQGVALVPNKLNPVTEAMACYARGKVLLAQPHPTEVIHELDLAVSLATDHSTAYEMRRELAYTCLYAPSVNRRRASEENVRALEERAVGLLKNIQGKGLLQEVRRYSNNVLGMHDSWARMTLGSRPSAMQNSLSKITGLSRPILKIRGVQAVPCKTP